MNLNQPSSKTTSIKAWKIAPLFFCSGLCALIYEVVWLRELRLVFGSSTASSSAVLAIFLGGLGLGGAVIGKYANKQGRPLRLYAILELLIAVAAMLTPFLISFVRQAYFGMGGPLVMGPVFGTLIRILLATIILGIPTFLMGGTLSAGAKAVETPSDLGRRDVAFLYGVNTLGGVFGVTVATFYMMEQVGSRNSLLLAGLLNTLIGMTALLAARFIYRGTGENPAESRPQSIPDKVTGTTAESAKQKSFQKYIFGAACFLGFIFLLMELVWYRMLSPILGGSTYTFGQILAVALLGIGGGGAFYATRDRAIPATMNIFALACALQALCLVTPYAIGDHLAIISALIKPLGILGLHGNMVGWTLITSAVVLPTALVSGYQFPLLIGLMGQGEQHVARHTGFIYAWNTFGSILGALIGGFILIPMLTAPGCWKLAVAVLLALALAAAVISLKNKEGPLQLAVAAGISIASLVMLFAMGPTAVWRHSPIGAGRVDLSDKSPNDIRAWMHEARLNIALEAEGVESSVGMKNADSLALFLNGKSDGNAKWDAGTQVMAPMISAILHPLPERSMVIGLGTGSGAGWLGAIDTMRQVDVVELEPKVLEFAKLCAPVNHYVLENPKVHISIGDGREVLLTSRQKYDLIFSEPSNPYRAGVASLYTREFYQAVEKHLAPRGMFSQWLQGYEVDTPTIRTIYTTLSSVFPYVETWETQPKDILFLCSFHEISYSVPFLRKRITKEPFSSALLYAWQATDLEGFLARYVAQPGLAKYIALQNIQERNLNTDDRMLVEFGFARSVGKKSVFSVGDMRKAARLFDIDKPKLTGGSVNWPLVQDNYILMYERVNEPLPPDLLMSSEQQRLIDALEYYKRYNLPHSLLSWRSQPRQARYPMELAMVAEVLANERDDAALPLLTELEAFFPTEAEAILALFHWRNGRSQAAYEALEKAFVLLQADPWPSRIVMEHALFLATEMAERPELVTKLYDLLATPFSVYQLNEARRSVLLNISTKIDCEHGAGLLRLMEPNIPWYEGILRYRYACYKVMDNPLTEKARDELNVFLRDTPVPFGRDFNKAKYDALINSQK